MAVRRSVDARDVLALLDAEEREALQAELATYDSAEVEACDASWILQWLAVRRVPFVKMAAGVCNMLASLEASLRGNISFVVLPEHGADLTVDFRPQMRAAVATALHMSALGNSAVGIESKLEKARRHVRLLCDNFRPQSVARLDSTGKMLKDLADATPDPTERFVREFQVQHFSHRHLEFNPTDVAAMARVAAAAQDLGTLAERLIGQTNSLAGLHAKDGIHGDTLISSFRELAQVTATKSAQARARRSQDYPPAPRAMDESRYVAAERSIATLKSTLLAASEAEQAMGELFDFFSLEFWQQRWRLYELWIMARVLEWFMKRGARVSSSARIVEGRWLLKFTRDSSPVLGLEYSGGEFDVYYQYFETGAERANMPDIALKLRDGAFIMVLDPKHGETYSRHELNEVCLRYAAAFAPAASCVMNYFARPEPVERLSATPACTVLYGLQPDSEMASLLDSELDAALRAAWRDAETAKMAVAVLIDVSPSTTGVRDKLCDMARQALNTSLFACSAASRVLLFAGEITADADVWDFLSGTIDCKASMDGTDIAGVLYAALERLSPSRLSKEIWLFTDGQCSFASDDLKTQLCQARARLRVWEATAEADRSALSYLAAAVDGDYQRMC